ncbi:copper-binding protein [Candidatus Falkowbacteria bacterium]|nr:copper-binding protein [Candidatus Falkowbacteria bacterium]
MKKTIIISLLSLVLATGCGSAASKTTPGKPAGQNQSPTTRTIDITNFAFQPATITINAGDTIVWTNRDSVSHNIKGQGLSSPTMPANGIHKQLFSKSGSYDYACGLHPDMKGKVIVQ